MQYKGIKAKILVPIIIAIVVIVATSGFSIISINNMRNSIARIKNRTVKEMEVIQELRYTVLHTAEILTDVSATHDGEGFEEAAEFRDDVYALTDQLKALDPDQNAVWNDILGQYEGFYDLCVKMANAYIYEGLDAGNELMEQVDPVTEELSELVDGMTLDVEKTMEEEIEKVSSASGVVAGVVVGSSIIYAVLMIYIAFVVIRQMVVPVTRISESLQTLAAKDLTVGELHSSQRDEIGGLVHAYNELRASLIEIMTSMEKSTGELEELSTAMALQSKDIMTNMSDITKAVNNVSELASNQASDIESSLSELDSLQQIAEQNAETSDQLSEASDRISAASSEGNKVLDSLYTISRESEEAFGFIFDSIDRIKDSTAKIGEASSMIENIAEQTNLLSLNASIEAARAGEAGKGFAVVADEIRSLSDESARSVNEINRMIHELQENVEKANKQSQIVRGSVEKQMNGVEDTRKSYGEIARNLELINDEITKLGKLSGDMTVSCNTVGGAMRNISKAAEENAANSEETTASIEEALSMTEGIAADSGKIKDGTDVLQNMVSKYKL